MRLCGRSFLLALAMVGVAMAGQAQNGAASKAQVDRCTDWLNTMVPTDMRVDLAAFCAGAKQEQVPGLGGWYSVAHCGATAKPGADGKEPFCASSGAIDPDWAVAMGFRSGVKDGGDLMPNAENDVGAAATLYTRTPVQLGALRLAAGLYQITISHPSDGWKMTVATEGGEEIGMAPLIVDEEKGYIGSGLAMAVHHAGLSCKDPVNVHELRFSYGGKDLYACFRPDRIAVTEETSAR